MDRILEWIAENPVYAGVIIAAAVIIVVLVILLIVHAARKSKRNKEKQELSESAAMQNGTDAQAENAAAGEAVSPSDEQTEPVCSKAEPAETEPVLAAQYEAETAPAPLPETDEPTVQPEGSSELRESELFSETAAPISAEPSAPADTASPETDAASDPEDSTPVPVAESPAEEESQPLAEESKPLAKETKPASKKRSTKTAEPTKKSTRTTQPKAEEPEKRSAYSGKWMIFKNEDKSCYFELRASNGEKLLRSLNYTSLQGARSAINTYKNNIAKDNISIAQSKTGQYYFQLLSGSKQLLCTGETYSSRPSCESAVESVKRFAETAVVTVAAEEPADE